MKLRPADHEFGARDSSLVIAQRRGEMVGVPWGGTGEIVKRPPDGSAKRTSAPEWSRERVTIPLETRSQDRGQPRHSAEFVLPPHGWSPPPAEAPHSTSPQERRGDDLSMFRTRWWCHLSKRLCSWDLLPIVAHGPDFGIGQCFEHQPTGSVEDAGDRRGRPNALRCILLLPSSIKRPPSPAGCSG